MEMMTY